MTALQVELDRAALQLAAYQNRIDAIEYGTAKWEDLDLTARAGYLAEAKRSIGALLAPGWRPHRPDVAELPVAPAELKGLREALCWAQTAAGPGRQREVARIDALIHAIDVHRPLGTDGKHGDLHTFTCGCEGR